VVGAGEEQTETIAQIRLLGGVRVVDNGRGIPVDLHPKLKKTGVEIALTVLHGGGTDIDEVFVFVLVR